MSDVLCSDALIIIVLQNLSVNNMINKISQMNNQVLLCSQNISAAFSSLNFFNLVFPELVSEDCWNSSSTDNSHKTLPDLDTLLKDSSHNIEDWWTSATSVNSFSCLHSSAIERPSKFSHLNLNLMTLFNAFATTQQNSHHSATFSHLSDVSQMLFSFNQSPQSPCNSMQFNTQQNSTFIAHTTCTQGTLKQQMKSLNRDMSMNENVSQTSSSDTVATSSVQCPSHHSGLREEHVTLSSNSFNHHRASVPWSQEFLLLTYIS